MHATTPLTVLAIGLLLCCSGDEETASAGGRGRFIGSRGNQVACTNYYGRGEASLEEALGKGNPACPPDDACVCLAERQSHRRRERRNCRLQLHDADRRANSSHL